MLNSIKKLSGGAAMLLVLTPIAAVSEEPAWPSSGPVLLETLTVIGADEAGVSNPPSYSAQKERLLRRPGAESVVSVSEQDPGMQGNLRDVLSVTPGVFVSPRSETGGGLVSMRGSDIASSGPRNGRGVRAYIDGIPLGRTEAGLTNALLDLSAADYVEVYRGGNSLRYGAIASGGALNLVSKTGLTNPGRTVTVQGGMHGYGRVQLEYGREVENMDFYVLGDVLNYDGWRDHSESRDYRLNANLGWRPSENVENRTYFSIGQTNQELAEPWPLNELEMRGKSVPDFTERFDYDANFDLYWRVANRTTMRFDRSSVEISAFFLSTEFDHLPTAYSGIVDNRWLEGGLGARLDHETSLYGLPVEVTGGLRVGYTDGDFKRYRHANGGQSKGALVLDNDLASWLVEGYGETALEVSPGVRLFAGAQAVYTTRDLRDRYDGASFPAISPMAPGGPQPGRSASRLDYSYDFETLNPKFGANWEHNPGHFLFANVTRSYEVPTGGDLNDVIALEARTGTDLPDVEAQRAWTWEAGLRGAFGERFSYDITAFHMRLKNEILTRCAQEVDPLCTSTVAFNADRSIHNGIEAGFGAVPVIDLFQSGDRVELAGVWNYTDFRFDGDARFGDTRLPVIPRHQLSGELTYRTGGGYFVGVNVLYTGERRTTFDGSGGKAYVVPDYTLLGAKAGWKAPDGSLSLFIEGRNLTDRSYVADFSATPSVPVTRAGPFLVPQDSPSVRPGDGLTVLGGLSLHF